MQSIWFCDVNEEELEAQNTDSPFLGVFRRNPTEIAREIPRPATPFNPHTPLFTYNTGKSLDCCDYAADTIESPVACENRQAFHYSFQPLISVY